jgi:hypothetical protein
MVLWKLAASVDKRSRERVSSSPNLISRAKTLQPPLLRIFSFNIKLFLDRARAIKMNFYKKRDNIFVPIRM